MSCQKKKLMWPHNVKPSVKINWMDNRCVLNGEIEIIKHDDIHPKIDVQLEWEKKKISGVCYQETEELLVWAI